MSHPFTHQQIEAMPDVEVDDRLAVAVGRGAFHDSDDYAFAWPRPWYISPIGSPPIRRRILEDVGDEPFPWPPAMCNSQAECETAFELLEQEYDIVKTPRQNAVDLLKFVNDETEVDA